MNDGNYPKGGPVFGKVGEEKGVRWLVTVTTTITKCDARGNAVVTAGADDTSLCHNASLYVETEQSAETYARAACLALFEE